MNRKYAYIIFMLTLLSFFLILGFFDGNKPEQQANQEVPAEDPPFATYITGSGIVEPVSGNIVINSAANGIVKKIHVSVNDQVRKGDVLFQLDHQALQANLNMKQKKYEESLSNLQKLEAVPREEDLIIAEQTLNKAQAAFDEASLEYCMEYGRAKSDQKRWMHFYKYQQAEAEFLMAQVQFEKVNSGTWQPELNIAQKEVEQARASIQITETEIAETYVKSPIDGTVLQMKIHEGETLDPTRTALILGNVQELNLRVGINQFNELKFHPDSTAVAFKQGDTSTKLSLRFIHTEPMMISKKYLTNELNEKVDSQIFEVLYRIEKNDSHLFVGEQMDVYIFDQQ